MYRHTTEYCSVIKKNEMMQCAATQMELEVIILSEVFQAEKDKNHTISFVGGIENRTQKNSFTKYK